MIPENGIGEWQKISNCLLATWGNRRDIIMAEAHLQKQKFSRLFGFEMTCNILQWLYQNITGLYSEFRCSVYVTLDVISS